MSERRASKSRAWEPDYPETDSPAPAFPVLHTAAIGEQEPAYSPSHMAAHVATDDKTTLAQMTELASAPPPSDRDFSSPSSMRAGPAVPEWRDEELEDFPDRGEGTLEPTDPGSRPARLDLDRSLDAGMLLESSPFPAPPSKGKMAARGFYEYPSSFEEDVAYLEGEVGPSAPPFEAAPSAPPTGDSPSAPPLEDPTLSPSAPPLDVDGAGLVLGAPELDDLDRGHLSDASTRPSHPPDELSEEIARADALPTYRR